MHTPRMQIEFHDKYMLLAVAVVGMVVFCRPVTDCARFLCTLCALPAELRECGHCGQGGPCERAAVRARELLSTVLLAYCSLQPLWFWLASRAAWLQAAASGSVPTLPIPNSHQILNASAILKDVQPACAVTSVLIANRTAAAGGVLALDRSSSVLQVDALLVTMPFAVASALATAAWKHLCDVGLFLPADTWDTDLFVEESKVWEYEMLFQVEIAAMFAATLFLGSVGTSFEVVLYATAVVSSFQVFFATAARESRKAPAAAFIMSLATVVFFLVLLYVAFAHVDWRSPPRAACAACGLAAHLVIATGHQIAAGEASVASVVSLRVLSSAAASVAVLVLLALGTCA